MALTICEECKELEFPSCFTSITLPIGLSINQEVYIWLKDKNNHYYTSYAQAEINGDLIVTSAMFPDLKFTAFSGVWEFTVSSVEDSNTRETMTIATVAYTCVNITFFDLN